MLARTLELILADEAAKTDLVQRMPDDIAAAISKACADISSAVSKRWWSRVRLKRLAF